MKALLVRGGAALKPTKEEQAQISTKEEQGRQLYGLSSLAYLVFLLIWDVRDETHRGNKHLVGHRWSSHVRERFITEQATYQLVGPPEVWWGNFKEVSAWGKVHGSIFSRH